MRRAAVLMCIVVLSIAPCRPTSACPWFPPPDPCGDPLPEVLEDLDGKDALDTLREGEPKATSLTCDQIRGALEDPDPEVRLRAIEELGAVAVENDGCPEALWALGAILRHEPDPFLLYRALSIAYPVDDLYAPHLTAVVDLLEHDSADVRRRVAELLRLVPVDPENELRVVRALLREDDPFIRLELARGGLERDLPEARDALHALVRGGGPGSSWALRLLAQLDDSLQPILDALDRGGPLRAAAIDLLGSKTGSSAAQQVLLSLVRDGSPRERLQAAELLVTSETATASDAWQQVVADRALPASDRAVLVLLAGEVDAWQSLACDAKRSDAVLAAEIARILADQEHIFDVMHSLRASEPPTDRSGPLEPMEGATTVRCASRPNGAPRPGRVRLPAGALFQGFQRFTEDGVPWVADWDGRCWVRADAVNPRGEARAPGVGDVLEADVSLETLEQLPAALAASDLELFDPGPGVTGIRVRSATPELAASWRRGEEGRRQVLRQLEANARLRESLRRQPLVSLP